MANIDNLNFKVILDDKEFNDKVRKDIKLAQDLNTRLSNLLQIKAKLTNISAQDAAIAKRHSDLMAKQAIDQERIKKAAAATALEEEKVRTQAAKTASEMERTRKAAAEAALAEQRVATEAQRTATATNNAAVSAQRLRTETQRTATETQRTATATQNTANATARAELAQRRLRDYSSQTARHIQTQSRIMNELKGYALGYLSIHGASQLLSSLVRVTGEFELQKTTLAAMIGDLNKAEGIITRIQGLAVESPFQFKELTTYAKQLSAFSVPAEELYNTTKMLADISAGLGVGMDRIVLAYGQVRSAAFLRGQEVRQFTEAGIPILDELAKQFSELEGRVVSTTEVFDKISKRLVPFEMVAKVFKDMTSEGGKFFNMQEVQAETLKGKISNLKDAYEVMLNEIGKGQSENLKGAVDWARKLMTNYEETGKALVSLVAAYGVYRTTLAITTNLQSTLARNLVVLRREFRSLSAMLSVNPYALLAAGITAVGYGIYKASTSLKDYEKIQKSVEDTQQKYTENIALENTKLDALYAKLRAAKKGTEEYDKAKKNIYTQYAAYISELKNEGVAVDNLATLYTNLKDKMVDAAKARYRMTAAQNVEQEYSQGIDNLLKRFNLLTENMGNSIKRELMEVEKEALWQYILGNENALNIPEAEGIRSVATSMLPSGYGYLVDQAKIDAKVIIDTYSKARERIDRLFGEESVESVIPPAAVETPIEDEAEKAVEAIKKEIESLQTLKKEYEDWKALGVSDESIKLSLMGYFPNIKAEYGEDFITQLDYATRILEKIKELEKIAPDEAFNLMTSFGLDKASLDKQAVKEQQKAFEDSAKAAGRYFEVLRKWTAEDFNINGEGIAFDVSKITSELNEKINEIELKATKAREIFSQIDLDSEDEITKVKEIFIKEFGADAWGEFWTSYKQKGFKAIRDLAEAQKDAEMVIAQEKARDIGKKYAKELLKEGGVSLSELSDKTYRQLSDMADKIEEQIKHTINELGKIDSEEYDLTEDEKNKILALEKALEELGIKFDKVVDEKSEKFLQNLNEASTLISGVATELAELGKSLDSGFLSELGEQLESVTSGFQSVLNGFIQGGAFGGVVAFLSYGIGTMVNAIEKEINYQDILNEKAREYADIMEEAKRKAFESIAGTNSLGLYEYNTAKLKEAQDRLEESIQKVKDTEKNFFGPNVMFQLNLASIDGGWELYKDNGELNIDAIEAYYDTFANRLSRKEKKLLDELIENSHALTDASLEQAQYLRDIYNDVADSIADAFIDAYRKSGEAALDYSEIMNDIASKLVKDIIKKTLLEQIFTDANILDIASDINNKDIASATQKTEALLKQAENLAPVFEKLFGSVDKYIIREEEQEDSATIGSGIKGVTEDTANLLASYLNAIRADVSYAKGQREQSNAYLQQILTQVSAMNAPSLVEYQQQIAANTFNTAIATQAILSRLDSVITSEGGFDAIRTYS